MADVPEDGDGGFRDIHQVEKIPSARTLQGLLVDGRWRLTKLLHETPQETGGNFGVGYCAVDEIDGGERFVKVVDYRARLRDIRKLASLLAEAQFEVDMHKHCLRMSKVVRMIAHGTLEFEDKTGHDYSFLCLILERGVGDIKSHLDFAPEKSPYWKIWVLRDVALAVTQIERARIAHNDIKPSNVIQFESVGNQHNIKLGDVGRAVTKDGNGPFDRAPWAGDPRHKPIEVLYGWEEPEFQNRRTAADAYMLGNLMAFLFAGASLTERVISSLPENCRPGVYIGAYDQILDVVRHTWSAVIKEQIAPTFPSELRKDLTELLVCLTDPNPQIRGDRGARRQGILGMDRIHTRLHMCAQRALLSEQVLKFKKN